MATSNSSYVSSTLPSPSTYQGSLINGHPQAQRPRHVMTPDEKQTYIILWKGSTLTGTSRAKAFLRHHPNFPNHQNLGRLSHNLTSAHRCLRNHPLARAMDNRAWGSDQMVNRIKRGLHWVHPDERSRTGKLYTIAWQRK